MATIAQLGAKIQKNVATKDAYLAKFRTEQAVLTEEYDVLVAAEKAAASVADMTDAEKQAIATELGAN